MQALPQPLLPPLQPVDDLEGPPGVGNPEVVAESLAAPAVVDAPEVQDPLLAQILEA